MNENKQKEAGFGPFKKAIGIIVGFVENEST